MISRKTRHSRIIRCSRPLTAYTELNASKVPDITKPLSQDGLQQNNFFLWRLNLCQPRKSFSKCFKSHRHTVFFPLSFFLILLSFALFFNTISRHQLFTYRRTLNNGITIFLSYKISRRATQTTTRYAPFCINKLLSNSLSLFFATPFRS